MQTKILIPVLAIVIALAATAGWYRAHEQQQRTRSELVQVLAQRVLAPMDELLRQNAALTQALNAPPFAEGDSGFLQSYLIRIRRDGVAKSAEMKQRIDSLANNNTQILTLISVYAPYSGNAGFRSAADHFREYALSVRDRWQSVPEVFMAGGNLPASVPALPQDFTRALRSELATFQ